MTRSWILSRPQMMKAYTSLIDRMLHCLTAIGTPGPNGPGDFRIYGVPRGGIPVAHEVKALLSKSYAGISVTYDIMEANIIVDDIIDSGGTEKRIKEILSKQGRETPFFALFNKKYDFLPGDWVVFPWEVNPLTDEENSGEDIITRQLQFIGEDPRREGLLDTPRRVVKAWGKFFEGYSQDPAVILGRTFSKETYNQMVVLKDIEFYSHCEHHLVPFFGRVHIAYIPGEKVVGISKLARLVECFSRRLQIQERMTEEIASALETHLKPQGVAVFIEAKHLCMTARGVEKQNSVMVTSALKGACMEEATRMEFLLLKGASTWNH